MEREKRNLDGKGDCKTKEEPGLGLRRDVHSIPVENIEGPSVVNFFEEDGSVNQGNQHQQRTDHGVNHEFHRRIKPVGTAPDPDQKIHRHQHHFEENIEQHHIKCRETTEHSNFQQKHLNLELPVTLLQVPGTQ